MPTEAPPKPPALLIPPRPKYEPIRTVSEIANEIWRNREQYSLPGDEHTDWAEAEALYLTQPGVLPTKPDDLKSASESARERTARHFAKKQRKREIEEFFMYRQVSNAPIGALCTMGFAKTAGCGPTVLAVLTGENPMLLRKHYNTEGIPTDQMIQHLQQHGFEITRLTDELMKYDDGVMTTPITTRHVVMMNIRATANKNTWVLMWGNSIIHNYQKIKISKLTFANHNILEKFLVWNSRWINDHDLLAALMQSDFEKFEHTYENTTGLDRDRMLRDQAYAQLLFGTNDVSAFHLAETRDGIDRPDDDLMG